MATFQVPQFIEEKAKIIGPLTLSQFFYLAGAAAVSFASFYLFTFFLWLLVTIIVGGVAGTLAFGRVEGQEMPKVARAALGFFIRPRTYTWQRKLETQVFDVERIEAARKKMKLQEKLKSAILSVTTGKIFSPTFLKNQRQQDRYQVVSYMTGEKRIAKRVDYGE